MYVTGRLPLAIGLGVIPIVLLSAAGVSPWATLGGWLVLCAALTGLDVLLTPSPREATVTRRVPERARLGEPVAASIAVQN
ncbi:MAG: DUF58 domain-containing protein, partial [Microbacterium sp.]